MIILEKLISGKDKFCGDFVVKCVLEFVVNLAVIFWCIVVDFFVEFEAMLLAPSRKGG